MTDNRLKALTKVDRLSLDPPADDPGDDPAETKEKRSMARTTLRRRFLTILLPMMVLAFILVAGVYEWFIYKDSEVRLQQKLDWLSSSQSIILADPVARMDSTKVRLTIASTISDRDIIGMSVLDADGQLIDSFGVSSPGEQQLMRTTPINFASVDGLKPVGELILIGSPNRIISEFRRRLAYETFFLVILVGAATLAAHLAHSRSVGVPLKRLLKSIRARRDGSKTDPVEWDSPDELGQIILTYNEMIDRLDRYEDEQRSIRDNLEALVEERTHKLQAAMTAAESANRAKSEFLAAMSHDLRTPLNAIMGFSDIIRLGTFGPVGNPRYEEYAESIHNSGAFLVSMINNVLDLSKIEAGQYDFHNETLELPIVLGQCVEQVTTMAQEAGLTMVQEVPSNLPVLTGDRRAFMQIMNNLLSNAIKFTPRGGTVKLAALIQHDDTLLVAVTDTGIGMGAEDKERAVQPFVQADSTRAKEHHGTGLGLYITQNLMELFGGALAIDSVPNQGTTVNLIFPAHRLFRASKERD